METDKKPIMLKIFNSLSIFIVIPIHILIIIDRIYYNFTTQNYIFMIFYSIFLILSINFIKVLSETIS